MVPSLSLTNVAIDLLTQWCIWSDSKSFTIIDSSVASFYGILSILHWSVDILLFLIDQFALLTLIYIYVALFDGPITTSLQFPIHLIEILQPCFAWCFVWWISYDLALHDNFFNGTLLMLLCSMDVSLLLLDCRIPYSSLSYSNRINGYVFLLIGTLETLIYLTIGLIESLKIHLEW